MMTIILSNEKNFECLSSTIGMMSSIELKSNYDLHGNDTGIILKEVFSQYMFVVVERRHGRSMRHFFFPPEDPLDFIRIIYKYHIRSAQEPFYLDDVPILVVQSF